MNFTYFRQKTTSTSVQYWPGFAGTLQLVHFVGMMNDDQDNHLKSVLGSLWGVPSDHCSSSMTTDSVAAPCSSCASFFIPQMTTN